MNSLPGNAARRTNPFDSVLARANSHYAAFDQHRLILPRNAQTAPEPLAEYIHDAFRALVLNPRFCCVGAKSAISQGHYRVGHYGLLASAGATAGLAFDLFEFIRDRPSFAPGFSTFAASFSSPVISSELQFEQILWRQLQQLHELDFQHHRWDPETSDDPGDPRFSFSFAQVSFFVVGLHPASTRFARRFAWPTIVFNAHDQFEALRTAGHFERMQQQIRLRDRELQGSINPNLSNFGDQSEARQYSGRAVEQDWKCPFAARKPGR